MSHLLLGIVYETKLGSSFQTRLHPGVLYTTSETTTTTTTTTNTTIYSYYYYYYYHDGGIVVVSRCPV